MYTALRSTSRTLQNFLQTRFETTPDLGSFFGGGGMMRVMLSTPHEMATAEAEGLSLWLYRVVRDEERLNAPPERIGPDQVRPPPLPLRLHYLVTPITNADSVNGSETEQVILGRVMQLLHDRPLLRGSDLSGDFVGTDVELHARLETMSLEEITRVWDALEGTYQLSVSYEVSVVNIESELQPARVSHVRVAVPEYLVPAAPSVTP